MNISSIRREVKLKYLTSLFWFFVLPQISFGQELMLDQLESHSFLTREHASSPFQPNNKLLFDSQSNLYFNLSFLTPGASNGLAFGRIADDQVIFFDTLDVIGFPDQLINMFIDDLDCIHYSSANFFGGIIRKMNSDGIVTWERISVGDTICKPVFHFLSEDNNPMVLWDKIWQGNTYRTLEKIDNNTGLRIWESENLNDTMLNMIPRIIKEVNNGFHLFQNNTDRYSILKLDSNGNIIETNYKSLNITNLPSPYINMDNLGNTYLGVNAWGYRCPKINTIGDTVWFYSKPSNFGIEQPNRTKNIVIDGFRNVYISGPYRFEESGNFSMLLTKLDSMGNFVWETSTHHLNSEASIFPNHLFLNNDTLWCTAELFFGPGDLIGAILAFDLEGNIIYYEELEELAPRGETEWMAFNNGELAILGSSAEIESSDSIYQNILKYQISNVSGIGSINLNSIKVVPYPNPTSGWISFNINSNSSFKILNLQDASGTIIPITENNHKNERLLISHLSNGIYFVTYEVDGVIYTAKILKF